MVCGVLDDWLNVHLKARQPCFSRHYLNRAFSELEAGNTITAGVLMREAVARYLAALCKYYGIMPRKRFERTPATMLRLCCEIDLFDETGRLWLQEAITAGNKAAHAEDVSPSLIRGSLELLHYLLDQSTELVYPKRGGHGHVD